MCRGGGGVGGGGVGGFSTASLDMWVHRLDFVPSECARVFFGGTAQAKGGNSQ